MLNSVALDVIIGLIFVYLLYSLLATIIQEMLASWFGMRAVMLEKGIVRMLNDDHSATVNSLNLAPGRIKKSGAGPLERLKTLAYLFGFYKEPQQSFAGQFYNHPLIKYLCESKAQSKPSYITAQNFSTVLIDLLRGNPMQPGGTMDAIKTNMLNEAGVPLMVPNKQGERVVIDPETKLYIQTLLVNANYDLEKFRAFLEKWFNDTMDRVTGWYKRHIQILLFLIGFIIAHVFNVSTIEIVKVLAKDKAARAEMVQMAVAAQKNNGKSDKAFESEKDKLQVDIAQANTVLGLGWSKYTFCPCHPDYVWNYLLLLFGYLLTAAAISMGAPFWFDLLSKIISIRSAGNSPDDKKAPTSGGTSDNIHSSTPVKIVG
jgi:hypothetical protein